MASTQPDLTRKEKDLLRLIHSEVSLYSIFEIQTNVNKVSSR